MSVDYLLIYTRRSTSVLILYYSFRHNANELAKYREQHSTDNAPCSRSTVELFYYPFSIAISYLNATCLRRRGSYLEQCYCCYRGDVTAAMPSPIPVLETLRSTPPHIRSSSFTAKSEDHCQLTFIYASSISWVKLINRTLKLPLKIRRLKRFQHYYVFWQIFMRHVEYLKYFM